MYMKATTQMLLLTNKVT